MPKFLKKLLRRFGMYGVTAAVAALTKIIEELDELTNHHSDNVTQIDEQVKVLADTRASHVREQHKAVRIADNIKKLLA